METISLPNDTTVFYVTAASYPDGILEAHEMLHALIPFSKDRKYFGVSRPENDEGIVYRAAAEELKPGEGKKLHCDTLVLKKGNYASIIIHDYQKDIQSIGRAFQEILPRPDIDPQAYCVEWYLSDKDVQCRVRLED